jgi:hypothetical protein
MTSIKSGNNSGTGLPVSAESTELAGFVQSAEIEQRQFTENQAFEAGNRKPTDYREPTPQVTGRRAAVKVGGMAQQYALNKLLDAKNSAPKTETPTLKAPDTPNKIDEEF